MSDAESPQTNLRFKLDLLLFFAVFFSLIGIIIGVFSLLAWVLSFVF